MKKNKIILTALLTLVLGGCGTTANSSTSKPTESATTDKETRTETTPVTEAPVSTDNNSGFVTDIMDSSAMSDSEEFEETWNDDVYELMIEHLGGQVVPFFDMGKNVEAKWVAKTGLLTVLGSNSLNNKRLLEVKALYEEKGWTGTEVTDSSDTLTVTNEELHLSAVLSEDKYGYAQFAITYDEPFDATKAAGEWNDDVKAAFNTYLDGHILPYVYLGTDANLYLYWTSASKILGIVGKKWDDSIVDAAKKAFGDFQLTTSVDSYNRTVCVFTKVFSDGCSFSVKVSPSSKKEDPVANYIITYSEVFDASTVTEWKQDIKTDLATLDNHELPFIYLGTKAPTSKKGTNTVTITGNKFNTEVITTAQAQFEKAGWETYKGTGLYGDAVFALHTFDDGCTITASVQQSSSTTSTAYNTLVFTRFDKLEPSTEVTDWTDAARASMISNLGGHLIPFSFIGSTMTSKVDSTTRAVTVTGDAFNPTMVSNFKAVLEKAGWTTDYSTDKYGRALVASKTFDDGTVSLNIGSPYSASSKISVSASYREKFDVPTSGGWSQTELETMKNALGGLSVPYFYMGTDSPVVTASTVTIGMVTITGGAWNEQIGDLFTQAIEADTSMTWTLFDDGSVTNKFVYKGTDEKGNALFVTLTRPTTATSKTSLQIRYKAAYDPTMMTEWDDKTLTAMKKYLEGHEMPFVFLGSKAVDTNTYSNRFVIEAQEYATFSQQVLDEAKKVLEANGFTTDTKLNTFHPCLEGTKTFDDGYTVRFLLEKAGTADLNAPRLTMYLDKPMTDTRAEDYSWGLSAADQTKLDDFLGSHKAPDVFMGTGATVKCSVTQKTKGNNYARVYSAFDKTVAPQNNGYILQAKKDLETQGFTMTKYTINNSTAGSGYEFSKKLDDETEMKVAVRMASSNMELYISIVPIFTPTEKTAWNEKITAQMKYNFDGNVLPFFDIGDDNPFVSSSFTSGTQTMTLQSATYDDSIFTSAEAAFKADTTFGGTWECAVFEQNQIDKLDPLKSLYARCYNDKTKKTMTVSIVATYTGDKMSKYVKVLVSYF